MEKEDIQLVLMGLGVFAFKAFVLMAIWNVFVTMAGAPKMGYLTAFLIVVGQYILMYLLYVSSNKR